MRTKTISITRHEQAISVEMPRLNVVGMRQLYKYIVELQQFRHIAKIPSI